MKQIKVVKKKLTALLSDWIAMTRFQTSDSTRFKAMFKPPQQERRGILMLSDKSYSARTSKQYKKGRKWAITEQAKMLVEEIYKINRLFE